MTKSEIDPKTGEIRHLWQSSDDAIFELNKNEDRDFIDGEYDGKKKYYDLSASPPVVKDRPVFTPVQDKQTIKADGVDVLTVTGLPSGETKCKVVGPIMLTYSENSKKATITTNVAGAYRLRFLHWPYQDADVEFYAS